MFKILISAAVTFLFCAPALKAQVADSTATYNEAPEEIVIKSGSEDKIRTAKPAFKTETDDFESIRKSLQPDKDMLLFEPGEFLSLSRNYPEQLLSSRVIQPWRAGFNDKASIVFYPRRKFLETFGKNYSDKNISETGWTLSVTDEDGTVFHKYSGSGLPPETINWTGENDHREWIRAGRNYAPVYVFVDDTGALKTVVDDILKYTAIVFQKGRSLYINLDSVLVFGSTKSMKTIDKAQGEALLSATCDLIKRRYYNIPARVNVYAQTKELAEAQADQIKNYLKKELMTTENTVTSEGFEESFSQQRIEIVLKNR